MNLWLIRLMLLLQEFDVEVKYKKDNENSVASPHSRYMRHQ